MSEEEKKAIEWLKNANFFSARIYAPVLLSLIDKQAKEIEKLKEIIISIRHELKGNIISKKDDGSYGPAKNLTKQEVYKSYLKLICLLKANRVFLEDEDAIKELLNE